LELVKIFFVFAFLDFSSLLCCLLLIIVWIIWLEQIPDELQGRAWGVIGFISQIGYVVAYGVSGWAADGLAEQFQMSVGRGAAGIIMIAGGLLSATALLLYPLKSVRALERKSDG
jgi:MFS family permease